MTPRDNWERVSYAKCLPWLGFVGISQVVPIVLGTIGNENLEGLASGTSRKVPSSPNCSSWDCQDWYSRGASLRDVRGSPSFSCDCQRLASRTFMDVPSSPSFLGTIRTGILEGLASGTYWDVQSNPSFSCDCQGLASGTFRDVPSFLGTIRTGIIEWLASGTSWDVPSSPTCSCDCQDWNSRGTSLWDFLGCPKYSQLFLGLSGLGF